MRSLVIGDSVDSRGDNAFRACHALSELSLGNNIKTIGDSAFLGCWSLKNIVIPDGVTSIGGGAFYTCHALTGHLVIPDSVVDLPYVVDPMSYSYGGSWTFAHCDFTEVTIGRGLASIPGYVFANNTNLQRVTFLSRETIAYASSFESCPSTMVVRGYVGSTAETFATENGYTFEAIAE